MTAPNEAAASPLITWTLPPGVPEPQTITVTEEMVARGGGGAGGLAPWSSEPLAIQPGETVTVRVGGGAA